MPIRIDYDDNIDTDFILYLEDSLQLAGAAGNR